MQALVDILSITGPIYLVIGLGYAVTRWGVFERGDMRVFGKFTLYLAMPALLFNALSQRSVAEIFNPRYLLAYALSALILMAAGLLWARKVKKYSLSYSSMMVMGMTCPNSGFVGFPIILLTLGSVAGVVLALNMVVENLLLIPLLLAVADSERSEPGQWRHALLQSVINLCKNPLIIGIVSGFLFSIFGWTIPTPASRAITLFAQASGALSLFVIGGSLVGLKAQGLKGSVAFIALGKLILNPLVMLLTLWWVVPVEDPALRMAALITAALPMMGIYTILSQRHGHEVTSAAALLVTTVCSFFTLSALLWVLQHVKL